MRLASGKRRSEGGFLLSPDGKKRGVREVYLWETKTKTATLLIYFVWERSKKEGTAPLP